MINTNNCGKDPEENVKPYIWNLKRSQSHKFSHKGFFRRGGGQASNNRTYTEWCGAGGREGRMRVLDSQLFILEFFILSVYDFLPYL